MTRTELKKELMAMMMTTDQCDLLSNWESTINEYCGNAVSTEKKILIATCLENVLKVAQKNQESYTTKSINLAITAKIMNRLATSLMYGCVPMPGPTGMFVQLTTKFVNENLNTISFSKVFADSSQMTELVKLPLLTTTVEDIINSAAVRLESILGEYLKTKLVGHATEFSFGKDEIVGALKKMSEEIQISSKRGAANAVLASKDVAEVLYKAATGKPLPQGSDSGECYPLEGILPGKFSLIVDGTPSDDGYMIAGYVGNTSGDAGAFFCPYIPASVFVSGIGVQSEFAVESRFSIVSPKFPETNDEKMLSYYRMAKFAKVGRN